MAVFRPIKATALPPDPAPHSVYFIKGGSDVRVKGYVTDAAGTAFPLGIIDEDDVRSVKLDGFTVGSNTAINSDNSIFTAFRNTQAQLNSLSTAVAGGIKIPLPIDCSANPNYPPAAAGDSYLVTVGGRIGGASGPLVQAGDKIIAQQTNAGGNQATVGSAWYIIQGNIDLATTTTSGITRIATDTETNAGSENFAYVTPSTLRGGVRNTTLTGYVVGSNAALAATDTVLGAFGKVQGQLDGKVGGTGVASQVAFWNGAATQIGDSKLTFNSSTGLLTLDGDLTLTGAQTIQTSTGTLTLATAAGNGNIILSPHGTGNVGIGTSSPGARLEVGSKTVGTYAPSAVFNGTSTAKFRIDDVTNVAQNRRYITNNFSRPAGTFAADDSGYGVTAIQFDDGFLSFQTAAAGATLASERMRITSTGNVGIGTTAPNSKLEVTGNASIGYTTAAPTNGLIVNGNVGIGTSTPTALGAGRTSVNINGSTDSILWLGSNGVYNGYLQATATTYNLIANGVPLALFAQGANHISATTNNIERLRITSTGNVGIGTTTPARLLHVAGAIRITGTAAPATPAAGDQYFDSGTNRMRFRDGTDSWIDMGMFWESAAW
jgi:hypothetical protein